jgi:hypothetical protein
VDDAGEELEPSIKLLHRPVARAHDQAREIGIMQSQFFLLRGYAREGGTPSLAIHPQEQPQHQDQNQEQQQNQNQQQNQGRLHRELDRPYFAGFFHRSVSRPHVSIA